MIGSHCNYLARRPALLEMDLVGRRYVGWERRSFGRFGSVRISARKQRCYFTIKTLWRVGCLSQKRHGPQKTTASHDKETGKRFFRSEKDGANLRDAITGHNEIRQGLHYRWSWLDDSSEIRRHGRPYTYVGLRAVRIFLLGDQISSPVEGTWGGCGWDSKNVPDNK